MQPVTIETFMKHYYDWLAKFRQAAFWDERAYLVYFSGKEMAAMMERIPPKPIFPLHDFFRWAVKKLNWESHDDLSNLRDKLFELRVNTP